MSTPDPTRWVPPRWLVYGLILGLYLSVRGYHSREGDQAYRLPLLLHWQDPSLFADDPFVRAFEAFNPHRGALALLDTVSRVVGLSAALLLLWWLTFFLTCIGIDRLARAVWPHIGSRVGVVAIALVLIAHGGNIGTNHLFEPMLLDRLMGFALGWIAFALVVEAPDRGWWKGVLAIGAAGLIHPSVGVQLALVLGSAWVGWGVLARTRWKLVGQALAALGVAIVPGIVMNLGEGGRLLAGLPTEEFRLLSVELQGPQHMLPHLWRLPQWLAWGCYPVLALVALRTRHNSEPDPARLPGPSGPSSADNWPDHHSRSRGAQTRLAVLLTSTLLGLALAWLGVESLQDLRVTLFQPFRMATVARGLALIALSGHVLALWRRGDLVGRARAALLTAGLGGDWALVVATLVEIAAVAPLILDLVPARSASEGEQPPRLRFGLVWGSALRTELREVLCRLVRGVSRNRFDAAAVGLGGPRNRRLLSGLAGSCVLVAGLRFLGHHDTESGHIPLLAALGVAILATLVGRRRTIAWSRRRFAAAFVLAWLIPGMALVLAAAPVGGSLRAQRWARGLVEKCRFGEIPVDDMERLAAWCRLHTPASARFVGPPGPKTFRLWSLRSLAFNRAASPYHAAGLADWLARFRDHVGFRGSSEAFVRAYLSDRHGLERGYEAMTDADRAALAVRNGATFVVANAPAVDATPKPGGPLRLLHVEGRYAVYRVHVPLHLATGATPANEPDH